MAKTESKTTQIEQTNNSQNYTISTLAFKLRQCIKIMLRGKGKWHERVKEATEEIIFVRTKDFPAEYQKLAEVVLDLRIRVRRSIKEYLLVRGTVWEDEKGASENYIFDFSRMTSKQRTEWTEALLNLYACIIADIGKHLSDDFHPRHYQD